MGRGIKFSVVRHSPCFSVWCSSNALIDFMWCSESIGFGFMLKRLFRHPQYRTLIVPIYKIEDRTKRSVWHFSSLLKSVVWPGGGKYPWGWNKKSSHGEEICDIVIPGVSCICFTWNSDDWVSLHCNCQNGIIIYGSISFSVMQMLLLWTDISIGRDRHRRFLYLRTCFVRNVRISTL